MAACFPIKLKHDFQKEGFIEANTKNMKKAAASEEEVMSSGNNFE